MTVIPLSGERDGYKFQYVAQVPGGWVYMLTTPDGFKYQIKCYTPSDINELSENPGGYFEKHRPR